MKREKYFLPIANLVSDMILESEFHVGGSLVSRHNRLIINHAVIALLTIPFDLVKSASDCDRYYSYCRTFIYDFVQHDFVDTLRLFDDLAIALISNDERGFKDRLSSRVGIVSPIKGLYKSFFRDNDIDTGLRTSYAFLRYLKKVPLKRAELEDEALTSFLATEERLSRLDFTGNCHLRGVQEILFSWMSGFDDSFLPVGHGNGSVAEGSLSKADKYLSLGIDPVLECHLRYKYPDLWDSFFPFGFRSNFERKSRVKFVPKTATKLRTICMEPVTLQYFQQGVMKLVYRYIAEHNELSKHIVLTDQSQNQFAAKLGSVSNSYCTIDLSAASDSVSWDLVRRLFKGTKYLSWCAATRSTSHLLPDGTSIRSLKFAPMGSALCFPTECLIFCAVVEYVARQHDYLGRMGKSYSFYTVYGDDISCPSAWASEVIEVLSSFGFIVNTDKSFIDGPFRESCGKEYYLGHDITPVYYRIDSYNGSLDPTTYFSICSAANYAAERGFLHLRSHFISIALNTNKTGLKWRSPSKPAFVGSLGYSPFIYSDEPTNYHLDSRWNSDLFVTETRYLSVSSRDEEAVPTIVADTINYFEWLIESEYNYSSDYLRDCYTRTVVPKKPRWNKASITTTEFYNLSVPREDSM